MTKMILPLKKMEESICYFPPTMAMPLSQAIGSFSSEDFKDTLTHLLDFFEMSVQWVNCYMLSLACHLDLGQDNKGVARAVRMIDSKRPLSFGDSVNELFIPLLESLKSALPSHPLVDSLSQHVKNKRKDVLVGSAKEMGVIKIRNDYKGHSTSLSQEIYREVITEMYPKVEAMLEGLSPLKDAVIKAVTDDGHYLRLKGVSSNVMDMTAEPKFASHYFVEFTLTGNIDLFPLILLKEGRYVYVFQTLKGESVKYESSDENVHGFATEEYNREFDSFIQRLVPSFDIAKEANWKELCECMRTHSRNFMIQVQKEKKYSSELFVDRCHLSQLLESFSSSSSTLLPLSGDAGQGKTNQICNWTERMLEAGIPVMVFSCNSFSDFSLEEMFRNIFNVSFKRPLRRILDHLHAKAVENDRKVFFFFDAVNECLDYKGANGHDGNAPLSLYSDIASSLVNNQYTNFKIITTCRSYTWKNQILPEIELPESLLHDIGSGDENSVMGFTDDETRTAYRKYGELYQMKSSFDSISRKVMLRISDPLVLKFVCSNYVGGKLSNQTHDYTSIGLFSNLISDLRDKSFAGYKQYELLCELSRFLLKSYLDGRALGTLTNSEIKAAYNDPGSPLHLLSRLIYKSDGISVAYTELRNNSGRPVIREVDKSVNGENVRTIEFIYERFLEYMLARAFLDMHRVDQDHPIGEHSGPLCADIYVDAFKKADVNVVFVGAMRNALLMDIVRTGDFSTLTDLISLHDENIGVVQLVNDTIDVMIRENYEERLYGLLEAMLGTVPEDTGSIGDFNKLRQEIANNRATPATIARYNSRADELAPVMRLRTTACVAVKNMLLTDYFNENLYAVNILDYLWRLVGDSIEDVSNETCKSVYYLSRIGHTHSRKPLKENLARRIVKEMYEDIRSRTVVGNIIADTSRRRALTFVETATRLATLLIIDATVAPQQDTTMIREMLAEIRGIASYFTWNYRIVRLVMPFLQTIMRKQITFQSVYVNNAVEYQGFWDDRIVLPTAPEGVWSRQRLREAMDFVGFYGRHHEDLSSPECLEELERFRRFVPVIISSYSSGCSFSYFVMERIMIIVGAARWEAVREIFHTLLDKNNRSFEWFDYMQMSLLYVLFQLKVNSPEHNPEILELIARETSDWTLRCRGLFKAMNSEKANPSGFYKRNVVNWYCVAYCSHFGDNVAHAGDKTAVPLLYDLIDKAVEDNDKELLLHLLDNISELISDFGYVRTALGALKYIMGKYESADAVSLLDNQECSNGRFFKESLSGKIGNVLGIAKTYFMSETDMFLRSELSGLKFPGVESYSEEILNYHSHGETLSDLFTHKFGNFLLWGLMHEKEIDDFAFEAVCAATGSKDCFAWFDQVIRILCRRMFNVKI